LSDSQIDVENTGVRGIAVAVPVVNPCAIQGAQPSIHRYAVCIRGERMLDGQKYFDSFPDEASAYGERGDDQKNPPRLTAELLAALEELKKYFQQFLGTVTE
jgi:hypothetical protein